MKLLLDMNLPPQWKHFFQERGYVCVHWCEIGDPRSSDRNIMEWALANGYSVLTHDLDFGAMLAATRAEGPSVIQIRTQDVLSDSFSDLLLKVLEKHSNEIESGALVVVSEDRSRIRILPLAR